MDSKDSNLPVNLFVIPRVLVRYHHAGTPTLSPSVVFIVFREGWEGVVEIEVEWGGIAP
jgi:hypothetical protein